MDPTPRRLRSDALVAVPITLACLVLGEIPCVAYGFACGYWQYFPFLDPLGLAMVVFAPALLVPVFLVPCWLWRRPSLRAIAIAAPLVLVLGIARPFLDLGAVRPFLLPALFPVPAALDGLAWRARSLPLDDARRWAEEVLARHREGRLDGVCPTTYWSAAQVEICPERVPASLVEPWVVRPVVGIVLDRVYVDYPAVALSWYEYKLILAPLPARVEAYGMPTRRIGDDAFLIWDCQK